MSCGRWAWFVLANATILLVALGLPRLLNTHFICQFNSLVYFGCPPNTSSETKQYDDSSSVRNVKPFQIVSFASLKPSSVWCSGQSSARWDQFHERHCRFEWLCLKRNTGEYVFLYDTQRSTFFPAQLKTEEGLVEYGRLSSVVDHNLFSFKHLATVPYYQVGALNTTIYLVPGSTLLASRFKPDNLMHLLHDDILPLFVTIRQLGIESSLGRLFFDDNWNHTVGWHLLDALFPGSLTKLNFPKSASDSMICFEKVFIGISNATVWYQYGFLQPQGALARTAEELIYIRSTIDAFRRRLISALGLNDTCPPPGGGHSLLLVRRLKRRILNAATFFNHLQGRFDNLRLVILDKSSLSDAQGLRQLLQNFICADTVIGMHGSELILSLLMAPSDSSRVIELFPYGVEPTHYTPFRTLALLLGHHYGAWRNELPKNAFFPDDSQPAQWGGLFHLSEQRRKLIKDSVHQPLPVHLCCDNPAWLYRIYQDTEVDLDSFDQFLDSLPKLRAELEPALSTDTQLELFHLAQVTALECTWSEEGRVFLTWQPPWNLPFCANVAQYEVLIQKAASKEAIVVSTDTQTHLVISSDQCGPTGCNVWVKAKVSHCQGYGRHWRVLGRFSSSPLVCVRRRS